MAEVEGRKPINIKDFTGGVNKLVDAFKLKKNEFTEFINYIILSYGYYFSAVNRGSIRRYNTNAPTDSGTKITALYEFAQSTKSTNKYLIANTDKGLCYATDTGVFTSLLAEDNTGKAKFVTFNDVCYILGRINTATELINNVWDGTTFVNIGTPPCYQTFSLTEVTAGTILPAGDYGYIITYIYDKVQESFYLLANSNSSTEKDSADGSNIPKIFYDPAQGKKGTTTGTGSIAITNIPIGNGRVTARKIYRTKKNKTTYFALATIDNNTDTTYIDNQDDSLLTEELTMRYIFKPKIARYGCIHKSRLWRAYLTDDLFSQVNSGGSLALTPSASSGGLTKPTATQTTVIYKYAFANMGILHDVNDFSQNYEGYFGKLSGVRSVTLNYNGGGGAEDVAVTISVIPNIEVYTNRVAIFRNVTQLITDVSIASSTSITVDNAYLFKVGETVTFSNVGGTLMPNGDFTVLSIVDATHFTINFNTTGGTYTANTGQAIGSRLYYAGNTGIGRTTFLDKIANIDLVGNQSVIKAFDFNEGGNKVHSSLIEYSEIGQGDVFREEISINANDNDVITGISPESTGIVVHKERSIGYKVYTATNSPAQWVLQKNVQNIGASEPYSIVQLPTFEYMFLSNKVIYLWQGENSEPIVASAKIQSELNGLTFTNFDSTVYNQNGLKWVIFTYSTSSDIGNILVYDYTDRQNVQWYHFKKNDTLNLGVRSPLVTKLGKLLFGSEYNRVMAYNESPTTYQDEAGVSFVATNIKTTIQSKTFNGNVTIFKRIAGKMTTSGSGNITATISVDETDSPYTIALNGNNAPKKFEQNLSLQGQRIIVKIETNLNSSIVLQNILIQTEDLHGDGNSQFDTVDNE